MTAMVLTTRSSVITRADLDAMPDDGRRHELIDGVLVVTPAPGHLHQRAVGELYLWLRAACPPDLEVLLAPFDVALAGDTVMQPDLLVARRADVTEKDLPTAPVLAVEVLSPSTRRFDLTLKRARYEAAGCGSYWVVDPLAPSITAWDLVGGRYAEGVVAVSDGVFTSTAPFPVDIVPTRLVA